MAERPLGPDAALVERALRRLADRLTPLERLGLPLPRGPPGVQVVILDGEFPVAGIVAFDWAERGLVVITRAVAEEIAGHLAAGRLTARWWNDLLDHERRFAGTGHTGVAHDADADALVAPLLVARAAAAGVAGAGTERSGAGSGTATGTGRDQPATGPDRRPNPPTGPPPGAVTRRGPATADAPTPRARGPPADPTAAQARTAGLSGPARTAVLSGPVTFHAPPGASADEIAQVEAYVRVSNAALAAGALSPTGRVSTGGPLRAAASRTAAEERLAAIERGRPYRGHVGHGPDTTWTGNPVPWAWLDLSPRVNMSLGAQARRYPVGFRPTEFRFAPPGTVPGAARTVLGAARTATGAVLGSVWGGLGAMLTLAHLDVADRLGRVLGSGAGGVEGAGPSGPLTAGAGDAGPTIALTAGQFPLQPVPPVPGGAATVTVRTGDTLGHLADATGTAVADWLAANPTITDPNLISAGARLTVPAGWDGVWRIRPGDNLTEIADRLGTTVRELVAANPTITDPNVISAGDPLNSGLGLPGPPTTPGLPTTPGPPVVPTPDPNVPGPTTGPGLPVPGTPQPRGPPDSLLDLPTVGTIAAVVAGVVTVAVVGRVLWLKRHAIAAATRTVTGPLADRWYLGRAWLDSLRTDARAATGRAVGGATTKVTELARTAAGQAAYRWYLGQAWARSGWAGLRAAPGRAAGWVRGRASLAVASGGVARLAALDAAARRAADRAGRDVVRVATAEQLGWLGWLIDRDAATDRGGRAELARALAGGSGLSVERAGELLRRAGQRPAAARAAPAGAAADAASGPALAAVVRALNEAFGGLDPAVRARAGAGAVLGAGRAAAQRRAEAAGVEPATATRVLDRAQRGRGPAGWWSAGVTRARLDVPVGARVRAVLGVAAGAGVGSGIAVLLTGPAGALPGSVLIAGAALAGVRAVWSPRQARAPPSRATALRAGVTVAGAALAGLLGPAHGPVAVDAIGAAAGWLLAQPGYGALKALLSAAVAAGLVHRYVLRRQLVNQARGIQTDPVGAARASAAAAFVIAGGYGVAQQVLAGSPGWVAALLTTGGVLAAFGSAIVQKKETGRTRVVKALVAGALAVPIVVALGALGATGPAVAGGLVSAVLVTALVYAGPTVVAEYINVWYAGWQARRAERKQPQAQQRRADPADPVRGDVQRGLGQRWLDALSVSRIDTRLLALKAGDPVLAALARFVIVGAWLAPGADTPAALAVRFGLVAGAVWVINKVRDRVEQREFYGYRSSRALRDPPRPSWWRGDRLGRRADAVVADLTDALAAFGLPRGAPLDRALAAAVADRMWSAMTAPIDDRAVGWPRPLPGEPVIDAAVRAAELADRRRQEQHVEAVRAALPVLAADPVVLARTAGALRGTGRARDAARARVLEFALELNQRLWQRLRADLAAQGPVTPAADPVWARRLRERIADRIRLREQALAGPARELLTAVLRHYDRLGGYDHPNRLLAKAELARLEFDLIREGMRKPPADPLAAAAELFAQRARSAAADARAESAAHTAGRAGAGLERRDRQRALAATMRLGGSLALLALEAQLGPVQRGWERRRWTAAISQATGQAGPGAGTGPNAAGAGPTAPGTGPTGAGAGPAATAPAGPNGAGTGPVTALDRLLVLAGHRDPVTAAGLAAAHGGTAGSWATTLNELADIGAVRRADGRGYRAAPELSTLWRAAHPALRRAVRADVTVLPGGAAVAALRGAGPVPTEPGRAAYQALLGLLGEGGLVFRHWRDGWIEDAVAVRRAVGGLGYALLHPSGRLAWPVAADRPTVVVRLGRGLAGVLLAPARTGVERAGLRLRLRGADRGVRRADVGYERARRADWILAGLTADPAERAPAYALRDATVAGQVAAHVGLAEARADARARLAGAPPHVLAATLRGTERTAARAPRSEPTAPTAEHWLREVTVELDRIHRALSRHRPGSPRRAHWLAEAQLALARHELNRQYGWDVRLYLTFGGWSVMEKALQAADRLRNAHPDVLLRDRPAPLEHHPVIPHLEHRRIPGGDGVQTGARAAAASYRGRANRDNTDAAFAVTRPDGSRLLLVADGLPGYPNSGWAVQTLAGAVHAELTRGDRSGRAPAQALADAHHAAAEVLSTGHARLRRTRPHAQQGGAAYLAAVVTDAGIELVGAGSARAVLLEVGPDGTRRATQLTHEDLRNDVLTRWLATNYQPEPTATSVAVPAGTTGLLVLATDGVWRHLPPERMATELTELTDPVAAAARLTAAARRLGAADDATVAVAGLGSGGGPVALDGWSPSRNAAALDTLRAAPAPAFTALRRLYPALAARGPPGVDVLVFHGELPGVVAFGWAERGVVVIPAAMAAEIAAHLAAGRLDQAWWRGLLAHERDFHLPGGSRNHEHAGAAHDAHAGPIADRLRAARAARGTAGPAALAVTWGQRFGARVVASRWPNAARSMRHYLGNTGTDLRLDPDRMLAELPSLRRLVTDKVTREVHRAVGRLGADGTGTVPFGTGWHTHGLDAYRLNPDRRGDWYFTVGGFRYAATGQISVRGPAHRGGRPVVEVSYRVHVHDAYDWHPGTGVTVGPLRVSDRLMGLPARAGLAREFQAHGAGHTLHATGIAPGPRGVFRLFPDGPGAAGRAEHGRTGLRAAARWVAKLVGTGAFLAVLASADLGFLVTPEAHAATPAGAATPAVAATAQAGTLPAPAIALPAPGAATAPRVTVQPGDHLGYLAAATGTRPRDWIEANPGLAADPDLIRAGQELTAPAGWDGRWRVQPGDTVTEIAARLRIDPGALVGANPRLTDPDVIRVGDALGTGSPTPGTPVGPPSGTPGPGQPGSGATPVDPPATTPAPGTDPAPTDPPGPAGTPAGAPQARGPPWFLDLAVVGTIARVLATAVAVTLTAITLWQHRAPIRAALDRGRTAVATALSGTRTALRATGTALRATGTALRTAAGRVVGTGTGRAVVGTALALGGAGVAAAAVLAGGPTAVATAALAGFAAFVARGLTGVTRASGVGLPALLDRGLTVLLPATWVVNLAVHVPGALAATTPLALVANGLFAVADAALLATTLPAALSLARAKAALPAGVARWTAATGFGVLTAAVGVLTTQLALHGPWVGVPPLVGLGAALVYATTNAVRVALGRPALARAATAGAAVGGFLALYGLTRLWTDFPAVAPWATVAAAAVVVALLTSNRRGPPGALPRTLGVLSALAASGAAVTSALWPAVTVAGTPLSHWLLGTALTAPALAPVLSRVGAALRTVLGRVGLGTGGDRPEGHHGHEAHGHGHGHGHGHIDSGITGNRTAMWVTGGTVAALFATAGIQAVLARWLGLDSAALEGDIIHNMGDGVTGTLLMAALAYPALAAWTCTRSAGCSTGSAPRSAPTGPPAGPSPRWSGCPGCTSGSSRSRSSCTRWRCSPWAASSRWA